MSGMPGPSSEATTSIPARPCPSRTMRTGTSPRCAEVVMLRATSEIAVASSVWSVEESSSSLASSRARWRAVTTSASDSIGIRLSASTGERLLELRLEQRQPLLEVQGRLDVLELHPELDHREGHLGLDADDHRLGPAQARHVGDPAQGARDERVHDVERRDVDDDPARAMARDLAHDVLAQLEDVGVRQRGLDRGDQDLALLEDGDGQLADLGRDRLALADLVAEQPLSLLDAALEVADRIDLREVHADGHQRLGDVGGEAGDDHARAHETRGLDGLHEVVG